MNGEVFGWGMMLLPLILAALLVALGVSGTFISPRAKSWLARRVSRPLGLVLCVAIAAYQVFLLIRKPDDFIAWMILAFMAWILWSYVRGRKANSKTLPEMGTSE